MVLGQLARYIATGVTSTLVDIAALQLFLSAGMVQWLAVAVAFVIGVGVNLLMHKWFTFRDSPHLSPAQVARYLTVVAINLGVTELVVWLATSQLGWPALAGKLLSLPPVLAIGFSLSRLWVFPVRP